MSKPPSISGAPALWRLGDGTPPSGAHVALVPGALAPMLPLGLPDALRGAAREQVAQRQLVEQLSLAPGSFEMHPVAAKANNAWNAAFVVDKSRADAWRGVLRRGCGAVMPDYFALPTADGLWCIDVDGDAVCARLGPADGFAAEIDLAVFQLQDAPKPKAVLRLGDDNEQVDAVLAELGVPVLHDKVGLRKSGIRLMRWADATGGANLKDAPRGAPDIIADGIKRWRVFAVAAVLGAAAWLGNVWLETERLRDRAAVAQSQTEEMVRAHFIPSGPILDVRAQVGAVTSAVPEVVELPETALTPVQQFQTAAPLMMGDGVALASVEYRANTGLVATVDAGDFAALDGVVLALQDANFLVVQLDARAQQSGGVTAQLQLELLP